MSICLSSMHNTYMLIFWISTACGGASVIRILDYDDDVEPDDNEDEDDDEDDPFYFDRGEHLAKLAARNKDMDDGT